MMQFRKWNPHMVVMSIAAMIFLALSALRASYARNDFVLVYDGARCLLHGCNPYGGGELLYPPSTLLALSPLALFQYPAAWLIWFLLNGALLIFATFLILSLCPNSHRWLATALGAILLAGSSRLLILAQPSAFAISLVVIGVYCFLRGRRILVGALLLMLSLAVKPFIGGLIVFYLFFKGVHRYYAALAMAGALSILLCAGLILKMHPQSANWVSDVRANISRAVAPGATDDPRPASEQAVAALNLQTVTSVFFREEKQFNVAAYAVFAVLFLAWALATLRMDSSTDNHLLAIGALTVLTLLPIYHRTYDSRFLLLCIPSATIIFEKRRVIGAFMCAIIALATLSTQHLAQELLLRDGLLQTVQQSKALLIFLLRGSDVQLLVLFALFMVAFFNICNPIGSAARPNPIDGRPSLAYPLSR
jgi:hypothetical protein